MSLQALDRLAAAHEALIAALDASDLAAIEAATAGLAAAVEAARGIEPSTGRQELRERLISLAALAQAAQGRVNFLTDMAGRRIDTLFTMAGRAPTLTYSASAR
jgi:hypothetical protein